MKFTPQATFALVVLLEGSFAVQAVTFQHRLEEGAAALSLARESAVADFNWLIRPPAELVEEEVIEDITPEELRDFYVTIGENKAKGLVDLPEPDIPRTVEIVALYDQLHAHAHEVHGKWDMDSNGLLEWHELVHHKGQLDPKAASPLHRIRFGHWNDCDANKDQGLDKGELISVLHSVHPWEDNGLELVNEMDQNSDDRIGHKELAAYVNEQMPWVDESRQGLLKKVLKHMISLHDRDFDMQLDQHEIGYWYSDQYSSLQGWLGGIGLGN